jgi:hypothetical protein
VLGVGKVFVIVTKSSDRIMLARYGNPGRVEGFFA